MKPREYSGYSRHDLAIASALCDMMRPPKRTSSLVLRITKPVRIHVRYERGEGAEQLVRDPQRPDTFICIPF